MGPDGWSKCWYAIDSNVPSSEMDLLLGGEMSMWTDTYCYIDQCGASSGATPVGHQLFDPAHDKQFSHSVGGMIWPRGYVGAAAFWHFNASLDVTGADFETAIWNVNDYLRSQGSYVCPSKCACDQVSACGKPYLPQHSIESTITEEHATCDWKSAMSPREGMLWHAVQSIEAAVGAVADAATSSADATLSTLAWFADILRGHAAIVETVDTYDKDIMQSNALVVMIMPNNVTPPVRASGQRFASVEGRDDITAIWEPIVESIESLIGRRFSVAFTITSLEPAAVPSTPIVVFDYSTSTVRLRSDIMAVFHDEAVDMKWVSDAYDEMMSVLQRVRDSERHGSSPSTCDILQTMQGSQKALVDAANGGFLLCIACVVVLAIGLPMLANFALYKIVVTICVHSGKSVQQCDETAIAYLALVNLMLPFFALWIMKVCKVATDCKTLQLVASMLKQR